MAKRSVDDALAQIETDVSADLVLLALAAFLANHASLLGSQVNRVTRADLEVLVRDSIAAGESTDQLAQRIGSQFEGYKTWRAERIARTETATIYNTSSIEAYEKTGVVVKVKVLDGTTNDQACADANGQEWSLDYARNHPWQHPNCQRAFAPITN